MTDIEQRLAAAGLRVKPLEWTRPELGFLMSLCVSYRVYAMRTDQYQATSQNGMHVGDYSSPDAAMKACDDHNAAAILSSLEVIE